MINLQFNIRIPGSDRFRNIACWHGIIPFCSHKFWEVQVYQGSDIIDLYLRFTTKQSHAGLDTGIGLLGHNLEFRVYDNRHWDKELGQWCQQ